MSSETYFRIGQWVGGIVGVCVFIVGWIAAVSGWGWLLGVAFGWIPAAICAVIVGWLFYVSWGVIAAISIIGGLYIYDNATKVAPPAASDASMDAQAMPAAPAVGIPAAAEAAAAQPPAAYVYRPATAYSYQDAHGDADCTDDCSGHDAGYQWAEDNGIDDEDDCDGRSDSFNEGCQAYVRDNTSEDVEPEP